MTNEEAIEILKPLTEYNVNENGIGTFPMVSTPLQVEALDLAIKALEERPQGEWVEIPVKRDLLYNTGIKYTCSICGVGNCYGKPPFCMYCGAKMKGDTE